MGSQNKPVIIVTGSSRGIGAATAVEAARQGYAVCVNYLYNGDAAQQVAQQITDLGGTCIIVKADVSNESEVISMFGQTEQALGPVTALVNNVGILEQKMNLVEMSVERVNRVLKTNVTSVFLCCKEAVKRMSLSNGGKGGSIVNVSSAASRLGSPGEYIDYAASKGAVDSMTLGLSKEVADYGIRVNSVRPGFIYTDIHADGGEPDRVQRLESLLPMKRGGKPEEVADAIMWLLGDKSSFVTGTFIELAGGK